MKINSKEKEKRNLENYNTTRMFHGDSFGVSVAKVPLILRPGVLLDTGGLTSLTKKPSEEDKDLCLKLFLCR